MFANDRISDNRLSLLLLSLLLLLFFENFLLTMVRKPIRYWDGWRVSLNQ